MKNLLVTLMVIWSTHSFSRTDAQLDSLSLRGGIGVSDWENPDTRFDESDYHPPVLGLATHLSLTYRWSLVARSIILVVRPLCFI